MSSLEGKKTSLKEYKLLIVVATSILALIVASPALERFLTLPQSSFLTEFWILGPSHQAEGYPFNLTANANYNVFLGVRNELGHATYYQIQVKFRNETQPSANPFNHTASSLPSLYNINAVVADKENWELSTTFSFNYTYDANLKQVNFDNLTINGNVLDIKTSSIALNSENNEYLGNLFFELWIYNDSTSTFEYHERFTGLFFNFKP
jgi:uncharacterized membrane protein